MCLQTSTYIYVCSHTFTYIYIHNIRLHTFTYVHNIRSHTSTAYVHNIRSQHTFTTYVFIRLHIYTCKHSSKLRPEPTSLRLGLEMTIGRFVAVDLQSNTCFLVLLQPAPLVISCALLVLRNFSVQYNMFRGDFLLCLLGYWLTLAQKVLTVQ